MRVVDLRVHAHSSRNQQIQGLRQVGARPEANFGRCRAYSLVLDDPETHPVARGQTITVCDGMIPRDHTQLLPIAERNELFRNAEVYEGVTSTIALTFNGPPVESLTVSLSYMRNAVLKLTVKVASSGASDAVRKTPARSKIGLVDCLMSCANNARGRGARASILRSHH
jgi:hypothetical protein